MGYKKYFLKLFFFLLPVLLAAQFRADCRYLKGKTQNTLLIQPTCYGFSDGSIKMETDFPGIIPNNINYQLNNGSFAASGIFSGIRSGTQRIVTLNAADACRDTMFVFVPQPDSIRLKINIDTASCLYGGAFFADASGGTGALQYRWNTVPLQTTALLNGVQSLESYTVTVSDVAGCSNFRTAVMPKAGPLKVSMDVEDVKCFGEASGSISLTPQNGTAPYSYRWNDVNAQQTSKVQNLRKGSYTVTISDALQCISIQTVVINEPLPLRFSALTVGPRCAVDLFGRFSVLASGGTVPYSYSWKSSSGSGIGAADTLAATGLYGMTVTDANNCLFADTFRIQAPAAIDYVLSQTKKGCAGSDDNAAAITGLVGGTPPYSILWSGGQRGSKNVGLKPGSISVSVTDASGCTVVKSIDIREFGPIVASLAFVRPTCKGSGDGQMGIISLGGGAGNGILTAYTYLWDVVPVQSTALAVNLTGDKTYKVIIADSAGCRGMASRYLPEPDPIEVKAMISQNKCSGFSEGIISVSAKGGNPGFNYLWNDVSGSRSARIEGLRAGSYRVTVSDTKNCSTTATYLLKDPDSLRIVRAVIANNTCKDSAIGAIQLEAAGGSGAIVFRWSNSATSAQISGLKNGLYIVSVSDQNGCILERQFIINRPDTVRTDLQVTPVSCYGYKNGSVQINASGGSGPYSYSVDGNRFSSFNRFDRLTGGRYTVFTKDNAGCLSTSGITIGEPEPLLADAGDDQQIDLGASATFTAGYANHIGKARVQWIAPSDDIFNCISCDTVVVKPKETTILTLRVTDANGCRAEDRATVFLKRERGIFVAQAFSPNNDKENELLVVQGRVGTIVLHFRVFDQWGELLFEASDFPVNEKNIGWDGVFRGNLMPGGNYLWTVEAQYPGGEKELLRGSSLLIR